MSFFDISHLTHSVPPQANSPKTQQPLHSLRPRFANIRLAFDVYLTTQDKRVPLRKLVFELQDHLFQTRLPLHLEVVLFYSYPL
jgi:hypothetical protein